MEKLKLKGLSPNALAGMRAKYMELHAPPEILEINRRPSG